MIGQNVSHYRILDKLGGGGMGIVYSARDTILDRNVALKFLPADSLKDKLALERFLREARAAAALNHPNICTVHEIGEFDDKQPFIVMELMEGCTLKHLIEEQGLRVERVLDISIQVAEALDHAHTRGITHRDIKPANIFVTKSGQTKVLDFGLAKLHIQKVSGDTATPSSLDVSGKSVTLMEGGLTTPGTSMGTISYMSPEQARGEELGPRSDLFSFGAVLYEMATGKQAFPGTTTALIFNGILNGMPECMTQLKAELPAALESIVGKALEKGSRHEVPVGRRTASRSEATAARPGLWQAHLGERIGSCCGGGIVRGSRGEIGGGAVLREFEQRERR